MKTRIILAFLSTLATIGYSQEAVTPGNAALGAMLMFQAHGTGIQAGDQWTMVEDLRGTWKFELGDDLRWAKTGSFDEKWDDIFVPSAWEDEGYPGYDGYGWYRRHFTVPADYKNQQLYLHLGVIDDIDETYVNGHFVGFEGAFPPHFVTAYSASRVYNLPAEYLNPGGDNVVAVRVYDAELAGGIVSGRPGLYIKKNALIPDVPLAGTWKLAAGDDPDWKAETFDDHDWKDAIVPEYWETQGLKGYDGYGWYRRTFRVQQGLSGESLIMMMGRIDDLDEVYVNGVRIGSTGRMRGNGGKNRISDEWSETRAYSIPPDVLRFGQRNTVAVRVYDGWLHGGIYDGPIGIVTRSHYKEWADRQEKGWDFLDLIFKKLK